MTRQIEIEDIDPGIEKLIVTGMIVDTDFLSQIYMAAKTEYFSGAFTRIIADWCREYYEENKKAPGKSIRDIFEVKLATEVDDEDGRDVMAAVRTFLENLSSEFDGSFNSEYILRRAFPYLKHNSLNYQLQKAQRLADSGDDESALKLLRETGQSIFEEQNLTVDFPNLDDLREVYNEDRESLFRFPGDLGRYIGSLRRSKLIVFLGPTKRGKSHWLIECALQAVFSGLKVFFFSLELTKNEVLALITMRFLNKEFPEDNHQTKKYTIPVFDCKFNQDGSCVQPHCLSPDSTLIDEDEGKIMEFDPEIEHTPCTECLDIEEFVDEYEMATWFEEIEQDTLKDIDLHNFVDDFVRQQTGGSLKVKAYPISSASISDMENDLDKEEAYNQWVPDVIVIDSLDNFKKNKSLGDKRFQLGDIWEEASRVTKSRNLLTFSATQGNRGSFMKDRLEATDVAEDWSKAMVLDALFAINERGSTESEKVFKDKYWKRQQIECLLHRYKGILPGQQCMVLQNFELGQTVLDSKICMYQKLTGGID